jgi:DNA polymerase epsilon subunit 1
MDVKGGIIENLKIREDMLTRPDLKVLAFDIETSKDPLKFPDAEKDVVMMISLMFDGEAYLIINLGFCGQNVESFKYDPKPEFACNVTVFNEESEKATLEKFFKLIQVYRPSVITSFNGDKFDLPFIKIRCDKL